MNNVEQLLNALFTALENLWNSANFQAHRTLLKVGIFVAVYLVWIPIIITIGIIMQPSMNRALVLVALGIFPFFAIIGLTLWALNGVRNRQPVLLIVGVTASLWSERARRLWNDPGRFLAGAAGAPLITALLVAILPLGVDRRASVIACAAILALWLSVAAGWQSKLLKFALIAIIIGFTLVIFAKWANQNDFIEYARTAATTVTPAPAAPSPTQSSAPTIVVQRVELPSALIDNLPCPEFKGNKGWAGILDYSGSNPPEVVVDYSTGCFGPVVWLPRIWMSGWCYELMPAGGIEDPAQRISFEPVVRNQYGVWHQWDYIRHFYGPYGPEDRPNLGTIPLTFRLSGANPPREGLSPTGEVFRVRFYPCARPAQP